MDEPSNFVEHTYQSLYDLLAGRAFASSDLIRDCLRLRDSKFRNCTNSFGPPSSTSRKSVESGSTKLEDGSVLTVDDDLKDYVWRISERFHIDEVEALVLLRSFLYVEGIPDSLKLGKQGEDNIDNEVIHAITEFYFEERTFLLRCFTPLFHASADPNDRLHDIATEALSSIAPSIQDFVHILVTEFVKKVNSPIPANISTDLREASRWAKQSLREQLCIVEIIFWAVCNLATSGTLVVEFFGALYDTSLGHNQYNVDFLLDGEATQLLNDIESHLILTAVQILNLERLLDERLELELVTPGRHGYLASPSHVQQIHDLVISSPQTPRFSLIWLAWAFVLLRITDASDTDDVPEEYTTFLNAINPSRRSSVLPSRAEKSLEATWIAFAKLTLSPPLQLFDSMRKMLASPILCTEAAASTASAITNSNDGAYRSAFKGLFIALIELVRVEFIPDFESLVEVFVTLLGSGEQRILVPLCTEYWTKDMRPDAPMRRALLDIVKHRYPVQLRLLTRVMRALSAAGDVKNFPPSSKKLHLNTDGIACANAVYHLLSTLDTYAQVISPEDIAARVLYESRSHPTDPSQGPVYFNTRPIRLPGGSILPTRSVGRILSQGGAGSPVVVMWSHQHSGWRVAHELLTEYVKKRQSAIGGRRKLRDDGTSRGSQIHAIGLDDIGTEDDSSDPDVVIDILDLLRSTMVSNPELRSVLAQHLSKPREGEDAPIPAEKTLPDLIEVTMLILNDSLSPLSLNSASPPTRLVTSAIGLLSSLLHDFPGRVWPFLRASYQLFGDEKQIGSTPVLLDSERRSGAYGMTLGLLDLVQALLDESCQMMYHHSRTLQEVKVDVLLRAVRFVHNVIWIDHASWKYSKLSQRLEIGRKIASLYGDILAQAPSLLSASAEAMPTLTSLAKVVLESFVSSAVGSSVNPFINTISTASQLLKALCDAKRFSDAHDLIALLKSYFTLCRLLLARGRELSSESESKISLLHQALLSGASSNGISSNSRHSRVGLVDAVATFVTETKYANLQLEALQLLTALCDSLSSASSSPPSLASHFLHPERVVNAVVRLAQNGSDLHLQRAAWNFLCVAVDTQPALAALIVSGHLQALPSIKGKKKESSVKSGQTDMNGVEAALEVVREWKQLWFDAPMVLASALGLLSLVFQNGVEHTAAVEKVKQDASLWKGLAELIREELGEAPHTVVDDMIEVDGEIHTSLHEATNEYSCRTVAKSHAVRLLASGLPRAPESSNSPVVSALRTVCTKLSDLLQEATVTSFEPRLHSGVLQYLAEFFPLFSLDSTRTHRHPFERAFGDNYLFSPDQAKARLLDYADTDQNLESMAHELFRQVCALNLNWSLIDAQISLTKSWSCFIQESGAHLREQGAIPRLQDTTATVSQVLADESRTGAVMVSVHLERLELLVAILSTVHGSAPLPSFLKLIENVGRIISSEAFPPLDSMRRTICPRFHRSVLRVVHFVVRKQRELSEVQRALGSKEHLALSTTMSGALRFTVEATRLSFDMAREAGDAEIDADLELLVAVFEQCTRSYSPSNVTQWLAVCQESDLIRSSLELLVHCDFSCSSTTSIARAHRQPFYTQHILRLHLAFASVPAGAERLAHEGVMAAYSNNELTPYLEAGAVDVVRQKFTNEVNPAHRTWCNLLAVTAGLISAMGSTSVHFVNEEIVGFIQLYSAQILRVFSWNIDLNLTLPFLEETARVLELFRAMASTSSPDHTLGLRTEQVLHSFCEKSLMLLQQINYVLSHPNHLAALLEPITFDERMQIEKEAGGTPFEMIDLMDPSLRPLLSSVVQAFLTFSADIASTLVIVGGADTILSIPAVSDWPKPSYRPHLTPSQKVSLSDPASVGTFLQLNKAVIELARHLIPSTKTHAVGLTSLSITPFNRSDALAAARQTIEASFAYTNTQMFLWVWSLGLPVDESPSATQTSARDGRRPRRSSISTSDGLKRDIHGLAVQEQTLLRRAKEVFVTLLDDDGTSAVVLLEILNSFSHSRLTLKDR